MTSKLAVHTRTKGVFIAAAVEAIKAGKANTSYPRIVEKSTLTAQQLHALLSPVTELPKGYTVMDLRHVKTLDNFLKADGKLVSIITKAAKPLAEVAK